MPRLGAKGAYHTLDGDCLAFVVSTQPTSSNPDDDLEVVVFAPSGIDASTGLTGGAINFKSTHVDDKAGGFTPYKQGGQ
jgi:hypothetical protein